MNRVCLDPSWRPNDYFQLDRFYQQHYDKLMRVFEDIVINDRSPIGYRYIIEEATLQLGRDRVNAVARHYKISPKRLDCVYAPRYTSIGGYGIH